MDKKYTQKWCLVALLDDVEEGFSFHRSDWPVHVTLIGAVDVTWSDELHQKLEELIQRQSEITTKAIKENHWGPTGNVVVSELELTDKLNTFHMEIYELLSSHGATFNDPQYMGENYTPHSTVQKSGRVEIGGSVTLRSLSLIDMFPGEDGYMRKIVKTVQFAGSNS